MPTVCERMGGWIASLRWEDVPERVRARARLQLANVIASLHAGTGTDAARAVRRAVAAWNKPGPATVIPTGEKLAAHEAILVNGAAAMALDYDDYLFLGHTGHSSVIASLAIGEARGASGRDLILAQVAANEAAGRFGASAVLGPQNGQAWSFLHAVGGAAAAAKLLGLDAARTAHALAIALYQPTFTLWPGFMGGESKVLTAAAPTVSAVQAAELAAEGMTGALDVVEHPRKGFWSAFTYVPLPHMISGFGRSWVTDSLVCKKYPGCAYVDTTLDALFLARAGRALTAGEIAAVRVDASLLTVEMDNLSAEHDSGGRLSPINVNFSVPLNVAIALLAGRHTAAELSQPWLDAREREIRDLAARVTLRHDWEMTTEVVGAFERALGGASVSSTLSPRDLLRVARGYRKQMGGAKRNAVGAPPLAMIARLLGRRGGRSRDGSRELDGVDFDRLAMKFPARVTIETRGGQRLTARQDVPFGAPAQERYVETVEEKFRLECAPRLGPRVDSALAALRRADEISVADLVAAVR